MKLPAQNTKCQVKFFERALDFRVLVLIVYTTKYINTIHSTHTHTIYVLVKRREKILLVVKRCNRRYANGCFSADMKYHIMREAEKYRVKEPKRMCEKKCTATSLEKEGKTDALCSSNSWHWQLLLLHVFFRDFFFSFLYRLLAPVHFHFLCSFAWCFVTLLMAMQARQPMVFERRRRKKTKEANE